MKRLHPARERLVVRIFENLGTFVGAALIVALLVRPDTATSVARIVSSMLLIALLWGLAFKAPISKEALRKLTSAK